MDIISNAIKLAMERFKAEHGENAKLEDGDEFVTVFNDVILIISLEDKCLGMKILAGSRPYFVDLNLNLTE